MQMNISVKMIKIDQKDKQILFALDKDGRQSISSLAKQTRISRDVCNYRFQRLQKEGIITGFITLIDFSKFGYQIVRLYLKLQNTTKAIEESMVKELLKMEEIITAYRTDGHYEIAIGFLVKDLHEYQAAYHKIASLYGKYIIDFHFSVFIDYLQYYRNYLAPEKKVDLTELSVGSFKRGDADQDDIALLYLLSENARSGILELSHTIKLPASTVHSKIRRLEREKYIVAYRAVIDYAKLGLHYFKVDLLLDDRSIIPGLCEYARSHPNIVYRDVTVGGSDFEFDCELESQEAFYHMIEEIRNLFPQKIRSYFYYKAIKIYKYAYFPKLLLKENAHKFYKP